jgi:hypothetical protein
MRAKINSGLLYKQYSGPQNPDSNIRWCLS